MRVIATTFYPQTGNSRASWAYYQRAKVLRSIGFTSYHSYLKSVLWRTIRRRVLNRDDSTCFACGKTGYQVHHGSYGKTTLRGASLLRLKTVCRDCHEWCEFDQVTRLKLSPPRSLAPPHAAPQGKACRKPCGRRRGPRSGARYSSPTIRERAHDRRLQARSRTRQSSRQNQ